MGLIDIKRSYDVRFLVDNTLKNENMKNQNIVCGYFDLDKFKNINIKFGLNEGDRILREIGSVVEYAIANKTIILHNGGDEFIILIPKCSIHQSKKIINKIRLEINSYDFHINSKIKFSIGISSSNETGFDFQKLKLNAYNKMINKKYRKSTMDAMKF